MKEYIKDDCVRPFVSMSLLLTTVGHTGDFGLLGVLSTFGSLRNINPRV